VGGGGERGWNLEGLQKAPKKKERTLLHEIENWATASRQRKNPRSVSVHDGRVSVHDGRVRAGIRALL
jgi:hypothetical protein